jgi:hypothetical protein
MSVTLFSSTLPHTYEPNWFLFFWGFMDVVTGSAHIDDVVVYQLGDILFALPFLILIFLNWGLVISASRRLKTLYRIFLLVLCPVMWWGASNADPAVRAFGSHSAITAVAIVAALVEVIFIIGEREAKSDNSGAVTRK